MIITHADRELVWSWIDKYHLPRNMYEAVLVLFIRAVLAESIQVDWIPPEERRKWLRACFSLSAKYLVDQCPCKSIDSFEVDCGSRLLASYEMSILSSLDWVLF